MVQFDKLRLSGFKSFVDPTELAIETGMTGIVGPNGCGKSNLVEALKWVMGETSAKQMRGSEMEDVIFSGAGTRPARNIAEVMLILDNKTRTAPAMVNDADQLDVTRRIERGHGAGAAPGKDRKRAGRSRRALEGGRGRGQRPDAPGRARDDRAGRRRDRFAAVAQRRGRGGSGATAAEGRARCPDRGGRTGRL